jgi:hypothetical protein
MISRRHLWLLAALVGLAGWIWWLHPEPAAPGDPGTHPLPLAGLTKSEVRGIEIVPRRGEPLSFRRDGEGWTMQRPRSARARAARVEELLALLDYGYIEEVAGAERAQDFGLAEPELVLRLEQPSASGGGYELRFGKNNPHGDCCYAMVEGDGRVLLLGRVYKHDLTRALDYYLPH